MKFFMDWFGLIESALVVAFLAFVAIVNRR